MNSLTDVFRIAINVVRVVGGGLIALFGAVAVVGLGPISDAVAARASDPFMAATGGVAVGMAAMLVVVAGVMIAVPSPRD